MFSKKSTSQPVPGERLGGVLDADSGIYLPRSVANYDYDGYDRRRNYNYNYDRITNYNFKCVTKT